MNFNYYNCDLWFAIFKQLQNGTQYIWNSKRKVFIKYAPNDTFCFPLVWWLWGYLSSQNLHSIWIKIVSICPPSAEIISTSHSHIIIIGQKNDNNDTIDHLFNKKLFDIHNIKYRYYGKLNNNIPVVVKILAIFSHTPEWSAMTYIQGHNGTNTRQWRFSAFINQDIFSAFKSCTSDRILWIKSNQFHVIYDRCQYCCYQNFSIRNRHAIQIARSLSWTQHVTSPLPPLKRDVLNIQYLEHEEISYE